MTSSSSSTRICFNSSCKDVLTRSSRGWRRRTGEFADLCDRCASAYEEGKFCETFHLNASGWRCCESCGKQIHCGCIVSFHLFVLLDAGGIECLTCARKSFILTPNPAWPPPPSLFLPVQCERIKDLSVKNWSPLAGSGTLPWHQAPNLFSSTAPSELHGPMPLEVDTSSSIDRLINSERLTPAPFEKKSTDFSDRLLNGSLKLCVSEIHEKGKPGISTREQPNPSVNVFQKSLLSKNDKSALQFGLVASSTSSHETNVQAKLSRNHSPQPNSLVKKEFGGNYGVDPSGETHVRNGRPRGDGRPKSQLLSRYCPRITDQELQQISGDPNAEITPLFEKMLSASDAGRIGRLVLPKKCAEAYFPPISQPEGLPLKVQDLKGKEWVFQFRFWPNNNSRMYVLEGVTPCIQSMQLQAGDIVTFSRIEPEGKLVMGFRKASIAPSSDNGNGVLSNQVAKKTKPGEVVSATMVNSALHNVPSINRANSTHPASASSIDEKSGKVVKEAAGDKSSFRIKKKSNTLGSKAKRLHVENMKLVELKLTWKEAQVLLRPPPNLVPTVVVVEDLEFEEYEDAPVIGRPTILAKDHAGEKVQWAQCEECFKWRKIPANVLPPSRWTCSENSGDPKRSLCSAFQELTAEELEDLLLAKNQSASKKMKPAKQEADPLEALEGLDALANLAIQEENEALTSSSQATTRHPRHRPGCTCIVCIQPPSGKGPKHKQTCTCNVCLTVKRRFRTLMQRRQKSKSEKGAEIVRQEQEVPHLLEKLTDEAPQLRSDSGNGGPNHKTLMREDPDDVLSGMRCSLSPFKGQIDLNIQPERDEELSPGSDCGSTMKLIQDSPEGCLRQPRSSNSGNNGNATDRPPLLEISRNGIALDSSHQVPGTAFPAIFPMNPSASTSTDDR